MKFSVLIAFFIAFILAVARADDLQDEIDAAMKKFCGGTLSNPLSRYPVIRYYAAIILMYQFN